MADVKKLSPYRKVAIPAIRFSDDDGTLSASQALKHPSKPELLDANLTDPLDRTLGYCIVDGRWIAFETDIFDAIARCTERCHLRAEPTTSLTLRQYHRFRKELEEADLWFLDLPSRSSYLSRLKSQLAGASLRLPDDLKLQLYPYQQDALRWLQFCHANELGCLLGDDMGLGKTPTAISFLASTRVHGVPHLVICPITVLENWMREFRRFCPKLTIYLYYGAARHASLTELNSYDCILSSYGTIRSDIGILSENQWNVIVLDEAQRIKNPGSAIS